MKRLDGEDGGQRLNHTHADKALVAPPFLCKLKNMLKNSSFGIIEFHMSTRHHHLGRFKRFLGHIGGKTGRSAPAKTGNEIPWKSRIVDIAVYADHRTRVEHGIDGRFTMVAHHQAAKLKSRLFETFRGVVP